MILSSASSTDEQRCSSAYTPSLLDKARRYPSTVASAKIKNVGEKGGAWKGIGCGLIAACGRECCSRFPLRPTEVGHFGGTSQLRKHEEQRVHVRERYDCSGDPPSQERNASRSLNNLWVQKSFARAPSSTLDDRERRSGERGGAALAFDASA